MFTPVIVVPNAQVLPFLRTELKFSEFFYTPMHMVVERRKICGYTFLMYLSFTFNFLKGRKIRMRHFRGATELPWIATDDHYDFNYQQYIALTDHVEVLPGDHLITGKALRDI